MLIIFSKPIYLNQNSAVSERKNCNQIKGMFSSYFVSIQAGFVGLFCQCFVRDHSL